MNEPMERYNYRQQKKLRCGYTTGSCATAAAWGAVAMLLSGQRVEQVEIVTPGGVSLILPLVDIEIEQQRVSCAVVKDSGDDPDVTDGMLIYATATRQKSGITVEGGQGIGRVTRPGLACAVGEAAINPVPRQSILAAAEQACHQYDYTGGIHIEIFAPEGEQRAQRTFNPRLGIVGGISILGTTGIVEPMSEQALVDTTQVEINMKLACGERTLLVTPGNYGQAFLALHPQLQVADSVKCSNYIGAMLDMGVASGADGILLVGHIGKMIKLAGGLMNTHSAWGDCRMEILAAHSAAQGASQAVVQQLMAANTTDEGLGILQQADLLEPVMAAVVQRIEFHLQNRVQQKLPVGALVFSNVFGILGQTGQCPALIERILEQQRYSGSLLNEK